MDIESYMGQTTIYRILRVLALTELVERRVSFSDFSVDTSAINILKFRKALHRALCGGEIVVENPKVDWNNQNEHIFYQNIGRSAQSLIVKEKDGSDRVMRFDEFERAFQNQAFRDQLTPVPRLIDQSTLYNKPILWMRLVCFGYICSSFIKKQGGSIGFQVSDYKLEKLLETFDDPHIRLHLARFRDAIVNLEKVEL